MSAGRTSTAATTSTTDPQNAADPQNAELRRQVREVAEERDIPRKATRYFADQTRW